MTKGREMSNRAILFLTIVALGFILLMNNALAQTTTSGALSGSQSGANSGSNSGAAAIVNLNAGAAPATQTVNRNDTLTVTNRYPDTQRVKTVPDVYLSPLAGGNPCVTSATVGASGLGFGAGIGIGIEDPDCEIRQQVALLANMGHKAVALSHFCLHNAQVAETLTAFGVQCVNQQPAVLPVKCPDGSLPDDLGTCPVANPLPAKGKNLMVETYQTVQTVASSRSLGADGFYWAD